jgi:hypothetical protein
MEFSRDAARWREMDSYGGAGRPIFNDAMFDELAESLARSPRKEHSSGSSGEDRSRASACPSPEIKRLWKREPAVTAFPTMEPFGSLSIGGRGIFVQLTELFDASSSFSNIKSPP